MLTAGIVIETQPGCAREVEHQLAVVPELRVRAEPCGGRLRGLCAVPEQETIDAFFQRIVDGHRSIVSIVPTFVMQ